MPRDPRWEELVRRTWANARMPPDPLESNWMEAAAFGAGNRFANAQNDVISRLEADKIDPYFYQGHPTNIDPYFYQGQPTNNDPFMTISSAPRSAFLQAGLDDQPENEFPDANPTAFNAQTAFLENQQERRDPNAVPGAPTVYRNFETPGVQTFPVAQEAPPGPLPVAAGAQLAGTPNAFKPIVAQVLGAGLPTFHGETGGIPAQAQAASMATPDSSSGPSGWDVAGGLYGLLNPAAAAAWYVGKKAWPGVQLAPGMMADAGESVSKAVGGFAPLDVGVSALRAIAPKGPVTDLAREAISTVTARQEAKKPVKQPVRAEVVLGPQRSMESILAQDYGPSTGGGYAEWTDKQGVKHRKEVKQYGDEASSPHVWTESFPGSDQPEKIEIQEGPWLNGQTVKQWENAEAERTAREDFNSMMPQLSRLTMANQLAQARNALKSQGLFARMSPQEQMEMQYMNMLWRKDPKFAVVYSQLRQLDAIEEDQKKKIMAAVPDPKEQKRQLDELTKQISERRKGLQGMVMERWAPVDMLSGLGGGGNTTG